MTFSILNWLLTEHDKIQLEMFLLAPRMEIAEWGREKGESWHGNSRDALYSAGGTAKPEHPLALPTPPTCQNRSVLQHSLYREADNQLSKMPVKGR